MRFNGNVLRHVASLPAYLAFQWANQGAAGVAAELRHRHSLRRNLVIPSLLPDEAAVVDGLERNGVFVTELASLGLIGVNQHPIMVSAGAVAARLAARAAKLGDKVPDMMTSDPADLMLHQEVYSWGLNAVMLRIAEAYLRQPVAYDGPLLFHTPANGQEVGTRRWHLDREDVRMVKVGLYLHDVDDASGPFQILTGENRRPDGKFDYRAMTMAELAQRHGGAAPHHKTVTCTGKSGSLVFADTARFYHRGKPATDRARSAIFFSYFSRAPRHPFFCDRSRLSRKQIMQLVEGLHPVQRESALWRDTLSGPASLVPPSLA